MIAAVARRCISALLVRGTAGAGATAGCNGRRVLRSICWPESERTGDGTSSAVSVPRLAVLSEQRVGARRDRLGASSGC
eukprot:1008187-Prymnesium_polylepis.1